MAVGSKTAATSMPRRAAGFRPASLDALNFLLADVRGALGPYLNVFLVTQQHWSQSAVGLVTAIGGLLGIAVQTPIGAAIDATRAKRALIVAALGVLAVLMAFLIVPELVGATRPAALTETDENVSDNARRLPKAIIAAPITKRTSSISRDTCGVTPR